MRRSNPRCAAHDVCASADRSWYGRALVQLASPGGRYVHFGQAGQPGAPARPLARLVLERGYRTTAGDERLDRTPYYILAAALRRGGTRPALRLECEDGWGLLRRWRPDALYCWSGKTIGWLVAELLYRAAGLPCSLSGAEAWEAVLEAFAIGPTGWSEAAGEVQRAWPGRDPRAAEARAGAEALRGTGLEALRNLLAKAGGVGRWQADGSLYCFVPYAQAAGSPYTIGQGAEIIDALYGRGLIAPSQARVFGAGVAATAAAGEASPRRYVVTSVDPHLTTAAECANRAAALADVGAARAYLGWVETPCQPGLEMYDLVSVVDPYGDAVEGIDLRIAGIVERYAPGEGVFSTRATFEGA